MPVDVLINPDLTMRTILRRVRIVVQKRRNNQYLLILYDTQA